VIERNATVDTEGRGRHVAADRQRLAHIGFVVHYGDGRLGHHLACWALTGDKKGKDAINCGPLPMAAHSGERTSTMRETIAVMLR